MPFAATVRHTGVEGDFRYVSGDWTGAVGDADGTFAVATGYPVSVDFWNADAENSREKPLVDFSTTSGITTYTIHNHMGVTTGRFLIKCR